MWAIITWDTNALVLKEFLNDRDERLQAYNRIRDAYGLRLL